MPALFNSCSFFTTSAKETAIAWFDRYRSQDIDGMVALFTPEAIIEYVPLHLQATALQLAANGWSVRCPS
jgi:hypothetical protein